MCYLHVQESFYCWPRSAVLTNIFHCIFGIDLSHKRSSPSTFYKCLTAIQNCWHGHNSMDNSISIAHRLPHQVFESSSMKSLTNAKHGHCMHLTVGMWDPCWNHIDVTISGSGIHNMHTFATQSWASWFPTAKIHHATCIIHQPGWLSLGSTKPSIHQLTIGTFYRQPSSSIVGPHQSPNKHCHSHHKEIIHPKPLMPWQWCLPICPL